MNFISKYFKDKKDQKLAIDEALRVQKELADEALRKRQEAIENTRLAVIEAEENKQKLISDEKFWMSSDLPLHKLIGKPYDIENPPLEAIRDRYKWNPAFITYLRECGHSGEHDHEVIAAWEKKTERDRSVRLMALEKETRKKSDEPWAEIVSETYDPDTKEVAVKLDWNDAHIKMLRRNGYTGHSDQEIIDKWFKRLSEEVAGDIAATKYDA